MLFNEKILKIAIVFIFICCLLVCCSVKNDTRNKESKESAVIVDMTPEPLVIETPTMPPTADYVPIDENEIRVKLAAEHAKLEVYEEIIPIVKDKRAKEQIESEKQTVENNIEYYADLYDAYYVSITQERRGQQFYNYPEAATIWYYLDEKGFNDAVKAGIMGNIMVECAGQTLVIDPMAINNNGYFGICQWSKTFYPEVWDLNLMDQLEYLMSTMEFEFDTFGHNYAQGFNYSCFKTMTNPREAAAAFAKCYERCAAETYQPRENCAETAYIYFVGSYYG